ncbi:MAG: hypothetical protein Terrestrivirus12_20 [Terrestrivirus sp.]|uniref:Uncharacterized protein n=1 Tax=Terrestrivirus sp. TaxID=2487775 RepID=A0A3G4ZPA9_9VIRU|nr:MAG: hypothetical protein Terrestrivirus12_20 [Terrestrivirus sp.]
MSFNRKIRNDELDFGSDGSDSDSDYNPREIKHKIMEIVDNILFDPIHGSVTNFVGPNSLAGPNSDVVVPTTFV